MNPEATLIVVLAVQAVIGFGGGAFAARKGYSYWRFSLASLVAWPIALVIALVVPNRSEGIRTGALVELRDSVALNDGGTIPRGHRAVVEDVSVIDGHAVVRIKAPNQSLRCVAKGMTVPPSGRN